MQRRASSTYGATNASVGQASRHAVHVPQWSAANGCVGFQLHIGEQRGEEEPATELLVEQQRVLADPAEPGELRELALQERRGIDDAADLATGHLALQPLGESIEPLPNQRRDSRRPRRSATPSPALAPA